jgi:hypothetical protein
MYLILTSKSTAPQRHARTSYAIWSRGIGIPISTLWRRANNKPSVADKAARQQRPKTGDELLSKSEKRKAEQGDSSMEHEWLLFDFRFIDWFGTSGYSVFLSIHYADVTLRFTSLDYVYSNLFVYHIPLKISSRLKMRSSKR